MLGKIKSVLIIFPILLSFSSQDLVNAGNQATIASMEKNAKIAYQFRRYRQAELIWLNLLKEKDLPTGKKSKIFTNLASVYRLNNQPNKEIEMLTKAITAYRQNKEDKSQYLLAAALVDRAQVHNNLSQTDISVSLLREAAKIARQENAREIEAVAYQGLGNAYFLVGKTEQALINYNKSLIAAKELGNKELIVVTLNNLTNLYNEKYQKLLVQAEFADESGSLKAEKLFSEASSNAKKALKKAHQAVEESKNESTFYSADALVQLIDLLKASSTMEKYSERARKILLSLPDSQKKAQRLVDLAELQANPLPNLNSALQVAGSIGDTKTESVALGNLGSYFINKKDYNTALGLTYQAQQKIENTSAIDIKYRWQWQAANILQALGHKEDSILAYQQAIASLQLIRSDLASAGEDSEIDFQLEVEPVYRQLIGLLLEEGQSDSKIQQALEVKNLLQLSELENYFGEECVISTSDELASSERKKQRTSVVNTIVLKDKTYIVLQLPDGGVKSFVQPVSQEKMYQDVRQLRYDLENQENEKYWLSSRRINKLLIDPIESELKKNNTEKLIFVNDGILRNIPMAALHDGDSFLIEKYPVSNSLGFDLKTSERTIRPKTLAFCLVSGANGSFPLPHVQNELQELDNIVNQVFSRNEKDKK